MELVESDGRPVKDLKVMGTKLHLRQEWKSTEKEEKKSHHKI